VKTAEGEIWRHAKSENDSSLHFFMLVLQKPKSPLFATLLKVRIAGGIG
jgi:hypothetical protein